jgi:hypothetical protein
LGHARNNAVTRLLADLLDLPSPGDVQVPGSH